MSAAHLSCGGLGAAPDASIGSTPSKGPVGKTIRSSSDKFLICARDSVSIQTGTTQQLQLLFTVEGDGSVKSARVEKMSEPDPDLQGCVLRTLRRLKFPAPTDGNPKKITYPLVLRPE